MSQEVVKKKAHPADVLTEMQRRFADYLVYNQGRTTFTDAALAAGYSPKRARVEGSELMDNPKVIKYLRYKTNEVNRSYTVTKNNYVLRQQKLSKKLEDAGKEEKCLGFENLIGKATGQFIETHLHGNLSDLSKSEKLDENQTSSFVIFTIQPTGNIFRSENDTSFSSYDANVQTNLEVLL